jgi:cytochrome oxidase assembly protein ShyY1
MMRRPPIVASVVVAAAVAVMVTLGVWQLQRARWKDGLLAQYRAAQNLPPIEWPTPPLAADKLPLFRSATGLCQRVTGKRSVAGENRSGESGYAHVLDCATAAGTRMSVEVGWSKNPEARVQWTGGLVSGIIAPDRLTGMRLVAASAPPGLEPSAPPSIESIPNNHRLYALQWFSFAVIALVIYGLAVRKRLREEEPQP